MEERKKIVAEIAAEIANMLNCNIDNGDCGESFEGWCEDGAIFEGREHRLELEQIAEDIAPYVNLVSSRLNQHLKGDI